MRKARAAGRDVLAQELMPLESVTGSIMRMRDGSCCVALSVEGRNDSLDTLEQKRAAGDALARCLRGVGRTLLMLRLPRAVDATAALVHIDDEAAALRERMFPLPEGRERHALEARHDLLVGRLRPRSEREALAGDKIDARTFFVLRFGPDAGCDDRRMLEEASMLSESLTSAGMRAEALRQDGVVEMLQMYFTPRAVDASRAEGRAPVLPKGSPRRRRGERSKAVGDAMLVNAVTPSIEEMRDRLGADELLVQVESFDTYLARVDVGWLDVLFRRTSMPVAMRLDPIDAGDLLYGIDHHETQIEGEMAARRLRASERNSLERERRHGEEMLDLVGDSSERFFSVTLSAVVRARTAEELEREANYLRSACKGEGLNFITIPNNQLASWLAASPLAAPDRTASERTAVPMPASTVGYTNFAKRPGLDDLEGVTIGHDPHSGIVRLNVVNRTDRRVNSNVVVLGKSGMGKTKLVEHMALEEHLLYGTKLIIIDPDHQFSGLARSLGGEVVKMNASSSAKLSPLQPRAISFSEGDDEAADDAGADRVLSTTIPFAKSFLGRAYALARDDMATLELALEKAYGKFGITGETTFAEYRDLGMSYPVMGDLYDVLTGMAGQGGEDADRCARIAREVRSAAVGIHAPMWNERTTLDISSAEVVCIDTSDMGANEELQQAQYFNILSWVWSEARLAPRTGRPIRIIADEGQNMLTAKMVEAAEMLRSMAKRIRKLDGGLTFICQDIDDLFDPAVRTQGAAVLNNSAYRFVGQADGDNLRQIAELYGLERELQKKIETAERGEFALFAGARDRTWVKVDIEGWEFELFDGKAAL